MTVSPHRPSIGPWWLRPLLLAGIALLLLAWLSWHVQPDGYLRVTFLDLDGDAVLIRTPGGQAILVDGGADPTALALALGQQLPFWQRSFDAVILTQDSPHRLPGQIAALRRYRADVVLAPAELHAQGLTDEWQQIVATQRPRVYQARTGQQLLVDGVRLKVLAADELATQSGIALELIYGEIRMVLDLAGGQRDDALFLEQAHPVTVLVYPWQRDLPPSLLEAWQPQAIIFTRGYETVHPTQQTFYERAQWKPDLYHQLYHPDLHGTIQLVSDGQVVLLQSEQLSHQQRLQRAATQR